MAKAAPYNIRRAAVMYNFVGASTKRLNKPRAFQLRAVLFCEKLLRVRFMSIYYNGCMRSNIYVFYGQFHVLFGPGSHYVPTNLVMIMMGSIPR